MMNIHKMKAGKDTYYSLDLLDHGEGVSGLTNVMTIVKEYGASIKRVYQSNISFNEKDNEYFFEEFTNTQNPNVILEEDMFGKEKVWLKAGGTTQHILEKIEKDNVLNKKLKKEIIEQAILTAYTDKNIEKEIVSKLDKPEQDMITDYLTTGKLANKFVHIVEKSNATFLVDGGKCFMHIHQNDLKDLKILLEKDIERVVSTKKLLIKKSELKDESANTQIQQPTSKKPSRKIA
jgi:hypothetical protein